MIAQAITTRGIWPGRTLTIATNGRYIQAVSEIILGIFPILDLDSEIRDDQELESEIKNGEPPWAL